MNTLIKNVRIFDGTGAPTYEGAVLVSGNRIAKVLRADDDADLPDADQVIDGEGRTLMPGLVDAHTHLTWGSSIEKIYHQFILSEDEYNVAARRNARVLLDHGFTSLYSAGALTDGLEPALHDEIDSGKTVGPRLIPSTIERSPEGEEGVDTGGVFHGRGPDAMREFVQHCKDTGVESIKLVVSGEDALKPDTAMDILYTEEEIQAAGEAAKDAGLWIAAHTYSPKAIRMAIDAGARALYHCSFADDETVDYMAKHKDSIFYSPGTGVSVAALEANPPPHVDMTHMKASAAARMEAEKTLVPKLKEAGVRICIGGDYGFPFNPHGTNARDILHYVEHFGFTPAEALKAATMNGGELMGLETGQVKEGYLADLLLVDGDPTQNPAVLLDANNLAMIMLDGDLHKAPSELVAA